MGIRERSRQRRERIVGNKAATFQEAEQWDLEYWQAMTPAERLGALARTYDEAKAIRAARRPPKNP